MKSVDVNQEQSWERVSGYVDPKQERWLGLLIIKILNGKNLAVRDKYYKKSSDPYVIVQMGKQEVKTKVVNENANPEWNEALTLCVTDTSIPIKLKMKDKDKFTRDDKMGNANIDIRRFIEEVNTQLENPQSKTTIIGVKQARTTA